MTTKNNIGNISSLSRGAELWMHQARLLSNAIKAVLVVSFILTLVPGIVYLHGTTNKVDYYAFERYWTARYCQATSRSNPNMEITLDNKVQSAHYSRVIELTEDLESEVEHKFINALFIFIFTLSVFICLVCAYWLNYGRAKMADSRLRGASLLSGQELNKLIHSRDDASPYSLAGVAMRKGSENLHTLIAGAQGTGKSQQFFALMRQVRAQGKRAIVYDPSGEFAKEFYREGKDVLMNPLDKRSPNWNIWNEIKKDYHFDTMANGLIPDPIESDPFWAKAGRMVLKDVYRSLSNKDQRSNQALYNAVAKSNLADMHALLTGLAGATYVDPITERTGMSLKMTVQNQLEAFRFLHDDGKLFSIREWIEAESDSWMFITASEELRSAMSPVLSLWIDTAMNSVVTLDPIHKERLWFFIDELPTLQKLDILKMVLTNTRKYGLCCVVGVQDFSQLYEIYGHDLAKTIISGCQTKLLLRVTDGAAAKLMSELMGQAEINETEDSHSYGLNSSRDGVSVSSRRNLREIVLTSEILTLPDMHGYLVIPGDYPIGKVAYNFVPGKKIAEGFIERKGLGILFQNETRHSSNADLL